MLILGRRKYQSVVIGDEITLTVEEICDDDRRIPAASMRLGFQSPRYVPICRDELIHRNTGRVSTGAKPKPAARRSGSLIEIEDATARLRIQVPKKVPVCHNGTPTVGVDAEERGDGETRIPRTVHYVTCHKGDRVTICHNITISALDFRRFVPTE